MDIELDRWDTQGIVPMLKQLKGTKRGSPYVYPEDVPANLRPSKQDLIKAAKYPGHVDDKYFARWDWVIDEMIWAFETYDNDWETWELEFYSHDVCDEKVRDRLQNGFDLFGKYYQQLRD